MRILRKPEVVRRVGYSSMHIWRLERDGRFPKRLRLSGGSTGAVGWLENEVNAWIAERAAERDASKSEAS